RRALRGRTSRELSRRRGDRGGWVRAWEAPVRAGLPTSVMPTAASHAGRRFRLRRAGGCRGFVAFRSSIQCVEEVRTPCARRSVRARVVRVEAHELGIRNRAQHRWEHVAGCARPEAATAADTYY